MGLNLNYFTFVYDVCFLPFALALMGTASLLGGVRHARYSGQQD
jgi:hypothetical protein